MFPVKRRVLTVLMLLGGLTAVTGRTAWTTAADRQPRPAFQDAPVRKMLVASDTPQPQEPGKPEAVQPDDGVKDTSSYFPLKVGHEWKYKETWKPAKDPVPSPWPRPNWPGNKGRPEQTVTMKVDREDKVKDQNVFVVKIDYEKSRFNFDLRYAVTREGVQLRYKKMTIDGQAQEFDIPPGNFFLKAPLKKGDTWTYMPSYDVRCLGEEKLTVEAGTFTCRKLSLNYTGQYGSCNIPDHPASMILWLAADTGIVKQQWTVFVLTGVHGGMPYACYTRELVKFTPAVEKPK